MLAKILAKLPTIHVLVVDWHLSITIGNSLDRSVGATIGRHHLSLERNGDIARVLVQPPIGYCAPLSDVGLVWNSRDGLVNLTIPAHSAIKLIPRDGSSMSVESVVEDSQQGVSTLRSSRFVSSAAE